MNAALARDYRRIAQIKGAMRRLHELYEGGDRDPACTPLASLVPPYSAATFGSKAREASRAAAS